MQPYPSGYCWSTRPRGRPPFPGALSLDLARGAVVQGTEAFSSADLTSIEGGKDWLAVMVAQFTQGVDTLAFDVLKVMPSAIDHFEISSIADQVAGEPFLVEARAVSASGSTVPYTGSLTITDGTGTLAPVQGEMVDGVFTGTFTLTKATGSDTITVEAAGLDAGSNSFAVSPGPAASLTVGEVSSEQTAGASFTLAVEAFDAWGNPATGFNEACTITDATGTVSPATAVFAGGVLQSQVSVTKATSSDTIIVAAGGLSVSTGAFEVVAGPAASLTMSEVALHQEAGVPFTITSEAFDTWGNPAVSFNEDLHHNRRHRDDIARLCRLHLRCDVGKPRSDQSHSLR